MGDFGDKGVGLRLWDFGFMGFGAYCLGAGFGVWVEASGFRVTS